MIDPHPGVQESVELARKITELLKGERMPVAIGAMTLVTRMLAYECEDMELGNLADFEIFLNLYVKGVRAAEGMITMEAMQ